MWTLEGAYSPVELGSPSPTCGPVSASRRYGPQQEALGRWNTVERGIGYNHFMNHCGMEVILPDGSLVRTVMGGLPDNGREKDGFSADQQPGNRCWQLSNYGFGP
ncbi:Vanillyl-alcohol oxidase [Zalerion maritima]|uniref:Vanillyl-alcohol oxidase n=1 Tax=Zalerion maritima TaxID=339359 RepID=A0AAD5RT68_9PEZI|nr:Vanillyl-alcohol oxidase [Zalerion maritima]